MSAIPCAAMNPDLVIEPVMTRHDFERAVRFPWQVYAAYPAWVPPLLIERRQFLDPHKHPFFQHADVRYWLARRGAQDVGMIAAFIDRRANQHHNEQVGCFGCFEVLPDPQAAAALLHMAACWVRARGMRVLRGPFNFSYDNECGLLLNAYDLPPVVMTTYNPPYYRDYIEQAGFTKLIDWYAYTIDRATLGGGTMANLPARLLRTMETARQRRGVHIRPLFMPHFRQELAHVQRIYNTAWQYNPNFVPLDDAEINRLAAGLKPFIDPALVLLAEADGEVVGVSITLPDLNQPLHRMNGRLLPAGWWHLLRRRHMIDTVRMFAMGILPGYRHRGIEAAFYAETFRAAVEQGYQRGELSLLAESNTMVRRSAEAFGARIYKTYRVYERNLD